MTKNNIRFFDTKYYKILDILNKRTSVPQDDPCWDQFDDIQSTINEMMVFSLASTCYNVRGDVNSGDGYCITKYGKDIIKMLNTIDNDFKK